MMTVEEAMNCVEAALKWKEPQRTDEAIEVLRNALGLNKKEEKETKKNN